MIRVVSTALVTDKPVLEPASMLRGYIGSRFTERILLHNHQEHGYTYGYPLVQYKLMEGIPVIIGIEAGADTLMEILPEIETLTLAHNHYIVIETKINSKRYPIQHTGTLRSYRFATPWLGLNQTNYEKYYKAKDWIERKSLLNSILTGNILSMCKGLGIRLEERLDLHTHLDSTHVEYKGIVHKAFLGNFRANFGIPEFFGLGKGVSQGLGVVMPARE
jgi:hypothetical protein